MKYLLFTFLLAAGFMVTSCGGDSVDCSDTTSLNNQLTEELDDVLAKLEVFNNDPTPSNCNSFKDALEDYIDFLRDTEECFQGDNVAEWREALDGAEDSLASLDCQ